MRAASWRRRATISPALPPTCPPVSAVASAASVTASWDPRQPAMRLSTMARRRTIGRGGAGA